MSLNIVSGSFFDYYMLLQYAFAAMWLYYEITEKKYFNKISIDFLIIIW